MDKLKNLKGLDKLIKTELHVVNGGQNAKDFDSIDPGCTCNKSCITCQTGEK